jgi:hypothetical protein
MFKGRSNVTCLPLLYCWASFVLQYRAHSYMLSLLVTCSPTVGVLKEANEVSLRGLLKGKDSGSLKAQVTLEVLSNLMDKTLEGKLADEYVGGLLVPMDLAEGDSIRVGAVGLFYASGGRGGLASCLGGKLLAGGFVSGGIACRLLSTSHSVELFCELKDACTALSIAQL